MSSWRAVIALLRAIPPPKAKLAFASFVHSIQKLQALCRPYKMSAVCNAALLHMDFSDQIDELPFGRDTESFGCCHSFQQQALLGFIVCQACQPSVVFRLRARLLVGQPKRVRWWFANVSRDNREVGTCEANTFLWRKHAQAKCEKKR